MGSVGKWIVNPLLRKELRQRVRSGRSTLALSLYLFVIGVVAFTFMYLNVQGQTLLLQPTRTAELFTFLSYLQLALVSFVTPGIAAGVISGERERQTLAVLLTTPLTPAAIIVTKFLSSISFLLLLIIMTLPLYSIVFLFGGVVPTQVLAVFGLQIATLSALASVSIFWSTLLQRTGWSTVFAYGTAAALFLGFAVAGYLFDSAAAHNPDQGLWGVLGDAFYALDPIYMQASLESTLGFFTPSFHNSVVASVFDSARLHNLGGPVSWALFLLFYSLGSAALLIASTWRLRPGGFALLRKRIVRWLAR